MRSTPTRDGSLTGGSFERYHACYSAVTLKKVMFLLLMTSLSLAADSPQHIERQVDGPELDQQGRTTEYAKLKNARGEVDSAKALEQKVAGLETH